MIQYQLNFNTGRSKELKAANTLIDQLLKRYRSIVKDIKAKTAERKSLQSEKRSLSPVHIIRHNKLSNCISELTEDIEELKNQKNIVLREMYCENDKQVTNIEQLRSKNSDMLSQIDKRNVDLTEQKKNTAEEFEEVRNGIPAEDVNAIQEERLAARDEVMSDICSSLQKMYGRKYSYDEIRAAEDAVSKTINREMILSKKSLHEILRQNHQKITGSARTKKMDIEL